MSKKKYMNIFSAIIICFCMLFLTACGSANVDYNLEKMGYAFTKQTVDKMLNTSTASSYLGKTFKIRAKHLDYGIHYIKGPDDDNICCDWQMEVRLADESLSFPKKQIITVVGTFKVDRKAGQAPNYYLNITEFV